MSKDQIHKRLSDYQVTSILEKYQAGTIKAKQAQTYLSVSKSQFINGLSGTRKAQNSLLLPTLATLPITAPKVKVTTNILKELKTEKENYY